MARERPSSVMCRARVAPGRGGFTLIEVLVATALLGFSLIVMFGYHAQASRSNFQARKTTDCTYLAQAQAERLLALPWTATSRDDSLTDSMADPTTEADKWAFLEHPSGGAEPPAVDATGSTIATPGAPRPNYFVTWDVFDMNAEATWMRIRVRCVYEDIRFNTYRGVTISTYKYRD